MAKKKAKGTPKTPQPHKLRKSIIDVLGQKPKDVTIEFEQPKSLDDQPWSGNIYRYSF